MKFYILITLFFIYPFTLVSQKNIDSLGLAEDFRIFKNILYKGHPSLFEYIEKDSLDLLFKSYTHEIASQKSSDIDLFKKMSLITNQIKDNHLRLFAPNTLKTEQYYFPLILKIINSNFYTDTDDFGIPVGSKIITINNKPMSRVLEELKKYIPTDRNNATKIFRDIELKFGLFYTYEYGITKKYTIEYQNANGDLKTIAIEAESFAKVRLRNTKRNSYFASYHHQKPGIIFFDQYIGKKSPFVHYKSEINAAILVVNSFDIEIRSFKSKLISIFKEINKRKIKNLIIDVRHNNGGHRPNAVYLYSYLTDKTFKHQISETVVSLSIPERKHASRITREDETYLRTKFFNHPRIDGWKVNYDDMETIMTPDRNRFKGSVFVIVGGATFSEANTFALTAKNNPDIMLIGEETGGNYYSHSGEFPVYYEFPNSNIGMHMYMGKINHYIEDSTIKKGAGIPVDRYISLSTEDLIKGKDVQLDYVIKLIAGKNSSKKNR